MDNSVESYINAQPEEAMSYDDFYNQNAYGGAYANNRQNPDSIAMRFIDFFTGEGGKMRNAYNTYLDNLATRNEFKATQSARAWDEFLASTEYQRAFKDIEATGMNPYLLVNGGSIQPASVGNSAKASYPDKNSYMSKKETNSHNIALLLLAVARMFASFAPSNPVKTGEKAVSSFGKGYKVTQRRVTY